MLTNYDLENCVNADMRIGDVANEIIHSSQLLVFYDESGIPESGLLIASDWNLHKRVLHMPIRALRTIVNAILDNHVTLTSDWWNYETNKSHSKRE